MLICPAFLQAVQQLLVLMHCIFLLTMSIISPNDQKSYSCTIYMAISYWRGSEVYLIENITVNIYWYLHKLESKLIYEV